MKIYIMGAGAVGGFYGAKMAKAGMDVTFVGLGKHLEKMRSDGLKIRSKEGDWEVTGIHAITPEELNEQPKADFVLFTVKSYDTGTAAEQMKPIVKEDTTILTIQNGIDNPQKIKKITGANVMPGLTKIGVDIAEPGILNHSGMGLIIFGEESGETTERANSVKSVFDQAQIKNQLVANIKEEMWKKFMWNTAFNIPTAITNITIDNFMNSQSGKTLLSDLFAEITAVAAKEGVTITQEDINRSLEFSKELGAYVPSTLNDVREKRPLEIETFTGTLIKLADKHQIQVPVNKTLYNLIKTIEFKIETEKN